MILVGTDLSMASHPALQAGAALARKQGRELLLVTVVESRDPSSRMMAGVRIEQDAAELRREHDVPVVSVVLEGAPDAELLRLAKERAASLLVVSAEGSGRRGRRVGSVAEQLCQRAEAPVLVARDAERLVAWGRGRAPLSVLVGAGLGDASKNALECVAEWPDVDLTVAHVAWPYGEQYRLGTTGPLPLDHLRPEVHHQLIEDLQRWSSDVRCQNPPRLAVSPGWGRIDAHLAQLAHQTAADVLVVGSHQRNLSDRIWHGSVSRNALHEADCNVLCVPQQRLRGVPAPPKLVVVATDFSPLGDRAVRFAYSLLPQGGAVHLVHVTRRQDSPATALAARLAERVPTGSRERGVTSHFSILEGEAPWLAIWQYASRVSADLICLATHSRDSVSSLLIGSQAQALLQHAHVPVLLVPPDRET